MKKLILLAALPFALVACEESPVLENKDVVGYEVSEVEIMNIAPPINETQFSTTVKDLKTGVVYANIAKDFDCPNYKQHKIGNKITTVFTLQRGKDGRVERLIEEPALWALICE